MGRPKGSKNKVHKHKPSDKPKPKQCRRGRPKKEAPTESCDMSNVKSYKFLGYCKKCEALITTKELIKKTITECPHCHKKCKVNKLLKELIREKPKSQKEYLANTVHVSSYESLPLNDVQVDPKELKINEI